MFTEFIVTRRKFWPGIQKYKKHRKKPLVLMLQHNRAAEQTFSRNKRSQQIEAMSSDDDKQRRYLAEKKVNSDITIALTSLGFAVAGTLFFWPIALLSIVGVVYCSLSTFKMTYQQLKRGQVSTRTLVSMTMIGCILGGYFVIANVIEFLYLLSQKLLLKVTDDSKGKLVDIFREHPKQVWILVDAVEVQVPFESLETGQLVVVDAGGTIPIDGLIAEGVASIDQHTLTGESKPVEKGVGEQVFASTIVLSGKIFIEVKSMGDKTVIAEIGEILNNTTEFKATVQLRAEKLADRTVMPTLLIGGISLPILGPMGALAVINAHFKHKMSFIAPISLMNFLSLASQKGVLIKDGRSLDLLNSIDTIVFDKTGTLTEEQPHVGAIYTCDDYDEDQIIRYAAAAEHKQSHPIARAILYEAEVRQLVIPQTNETEYKIGYGLTVDIDGQIVCVGSRRFMEMVDVVVSPMMLKAEAACHNQGHSLVMVAVNYQLAGAIELVPTIRPEVKSVIHALQQHSNIKEMYIISGDYKTPTRILAQELGIDHYFAEVLPDNKAKIIEQLQAQGKFVCFIGDGINDSIALKKSHVSISLSGASTVATDVAQIILMDGDLTKLTLVFDFAQDFHTNMNATFAIVIVPTIIGIGGVFFWHFGLVHTIVLNLASLGAGILNAMIPSLTATRKTIDYSV